MPPCGFVLYFPNNDDEQIVPISHLCVFFEGNFHKSSAHFWGCFWAIPSGTQGLRLALLSDHPTRLRESNIGCWGLNLEWPCTRHVL